MVDKYFVMMGQKYQYFTENNTEHCEQYLLEFLYRFLDYLFVKNCTWFQKEGK